VLEQRIRLSLRRLRAGASAGSAVARDLANSPEVMVLYRVLSATGLAHHGFSATPPVFGIARTSRAPHSWGRHPVTGQNLSACRYPLLRFHSPTEFDQPALPRSSAVAGTEAPSMRFLSLRRRQLKESTDPGLPRPVRSASRFSQPPSGLLLLEPRGSISPHRHPWDSVLQSVLLDTCRDTSPVPDTLLPLPSCRSRVLGTR
jgi:hypothetical protein